MHVKHSRDALTVQPPLSLSLLPKCCFEFITGAFFLVTVT